MDSLEALTDTSVSAVKLRGVSGQVQASETLTASQTTPFYRLALHISILKVVLMVMYYFSHPSWCWSMQTGTQP